MTSRPRILVLGPAVRPGGYARVLTSLLRPLRDRYDVHQFDFNGGGEAGHRYWPVHGNGVRGDAYGLERLAALVEMLDPDLLLIVFDIWLYYAHRPQLLRRFPGLRTVLYCPIDGDEADTRYLRPLRDLDRLVLFTAFARTVVTRAGAGDGDPAAVPELPPVEVIPHGVDTHTFRPVGRADARRRLFPDRPDLERAFIVLNANQNNTRKRVDLTLAGFAEFARDKPPGVRLYLHMNVREEGCELMPLARQHGIEERLLLTGDGRRSGAASDEQLNLVYNACDVGLNTSIGEGWGLVPFEHAATGAAQVLPRHSVHEELWAGAAELVDAPGRVRGRHDFVTHHAVTAGGVAEALERLYRSPHLLRARAHAAYRRARDPGLSWHAIAERWHRLFGDVLADPRSSGRLDSPPARRHTAGWSLGVAVNGLRSHPRT